MSGISQCDFLGNLYLVVSTPLKNMKVSWGYYFQYMEKNETTNQVWIIPYHI